MIQASELFGSQGNPFVAAPAPSPAEQAGKTVAGVIPPVPSWWVGAVAVLIILRIAYELAPAS